MKQKLAALAALGVGSIGTAMADVPTSVTTALSDAATDSATVAGLALAIVIAIAAFKYMRRAV